MQGEELYKKIMSEIIRNDLNLQAYDKMLAEDSNAFLPVVPEEQNSAQKDDMTELAYIYIRNEIHLERLDEQQNTMLEEASKEQIEGEELEEMVRKTFPYVFTPKDIRAEEYQAATTFYDDSLSPTVVPMNALVLKIATACEYDEKDMLVDIDKEEKKQEALEKFAEKMEQELNGKMGDIPVRVMVDMPF